MNETTPRKTSGIGTQQTSDAYKSDDDDNEVVDDGGGNDYCDTETRGFD